jgi:hypothetical protein
VAALTRNAQGMKPWWIFLAEFGVAGTTIESDNYDGVGVTAATRATYASMAAMNPPSSSEATVNS